MYGTLFDVKQYIESRSKSHETRRGIELCPSLVKSNVYSLPVQQGQILELFAALAMQLVSSLEVVFKHFLRALAELGEVLEELIVFLLRTLFLDLIVCDEFLFQLLLLILDVG